MSLIQPPYTGNNELDSYLAQLQFEVGVSASSGTGAPVYNGVGTVNGYIYQYIHVKYADDAVGTGLSNSPTNKSYLGLFNTDSSLESTNPADYTWLQVTGGFGLTKFFFYRVANGRLLDYVIDTVTPGSGFVQDTGAAIDLSAGFLSGTIPRVAFSVFATNTLANNPIRVQTFGPNSFPDAGTWGDSEVWTPTEPTVAAGRVLFKIDGEYNPSTNITTWGAPFLAGLKVGSLSAVNADLGSITAGSLNINNKFIVLADGSTTIRSGTTGARVEILNNVIKVFDAAGTLRVQIGDLSA